jgi:hypothetical protein
MSLVNQLTDIVNHERKNIIQMCNDNFCFDELEDNLPVLIMEQEMPDFSFVDELLAEDTKKALNETSAKKLFDRLNDIILQDRKNIIQMCNDDFCFDKLEDNLPVLIMEQDMPDFSFVDELLAKYVFKKEENVSSDESDTE